MLPLPIWRLVVDGYRPWVWVEMRDPEAMQVQWACVDYQLGQYSLHQVSLAESWWLTPKAIWDGIAVWEHYPDPDQPRTAGVYWAHLPSGKALGQFPEALWLGNDQQGAYLSQPQADGTTQHFCLPWKEPTLKPCTNIAQKDFNQHKVAYPLYYAEENMYFATLRKFLELNLKIVPTKAINYWEGTKLLVLSYYYHPSDTDTKMTQQLIILDSQEGRVLWQDTLATATQGISLTHFCLLDEHLMYQKNKQELVILSL
jgi:hypothetical protein